MHSEEAWAGLADAIEGADTRFRGLCNDVDSVQWDYLRDVISRNAGTRFGSLHGFSGIRTYADYRTSVRIGRYEEFAPFIDALTRGAQGELTADPVLFAETTGGSTSGAKIIPYTQRALDDFAAAMRPWFSSLIRDHGPLGGRIYFALSPVGRTGREKAGVLRLGAPKRFAYFGEAAPYLGELSVAPPELASLSSFETWSFATCLHLLAARDLSLVWVWSPTYFTELIRAIQRLKSPLLESLAAGCVYAGSVDGVSCPAADPERAAQLDGLIGHESLDTAAIWPQLKLISCWTDASSAPFAAELRTLFPNVYIQPKGLMLTEGAVTVPIGREFGAPLAIESGFFEFIEGESVRRAGELEFGHTYRVVITNQSGFYRYDTGDRVEVVGFMGRTPRLVFKGRSGLTTDLCGEKLTEDFVLSCLKISFGETNVFGFLVACATPHPHYALCVDEALDGGRLVAIAQEIERQLCRNPQYAYARRLGQLSPLQVLSVDRLFPRYRDWAVSQGRSIGVVKAPVLMREMPEPLAGVLKPYA